MIGCSFPALSIGFSFSTFGICYSLTALCIGCMAWFVNFQRFTLAVVFALLASVVVFPRFISVADFLCLVSVTVFLRYFNFSSIYFPFNSIFVLPRPSFRLSWQHRSSVQTNFIQQLSFPRKEVHSCTACG